MELLLHLHIVKAAGSTLWRVLEREYGSTACLHLPKDADDGIAARINAHPGLRVVSGHFYHGLHETIQRPCRYLVLLRDPVERIISYYHHALSRPSSRLHRRVVEEKMDLEAFARNVCTPWMHDAQVHALAGGADVPDPLQRAKQNLELDFLFAGTVEDFDPGLILLRRRLGWRWPLYVRRSVNPRVESPGPELRRWIEDQNRQDAALFAHVRAAHTASWEQAGGSAAMQLRLFRLANRLNGLRLVPNTLRGVARSVGRRVAARPDSR